MIKGFPLLNVLHWIGKIGGCAIFVGALFFALWAGAIDVDDLDQEKLP